MIRTPAVAGSFYPGAADALERAVRSLTFDSPGKIRARAVVSPHAGYAYSGAVAGALFSSVEIPERVVVLCPNHTGIGADAAVCGSGAWRMPWGDVPIDERLASRLLDSAPFLSDDPSAHRDEHSLEVILPFLHRFRQSFRLVPIALGHLPLDRCRALGEAIAHAIDAEADPVLVVASSDMSHYVPDEVARRLDRMAIERMLALDPQGLYDTVRSHRITMCGVLPATVALFAALSLGASEARLVKYATSGETSGDYEAVVGYAGLLFS